MCYTLELIFIMQSLAVHFHFANYPSLLATASLKYHCSCCFWGRGSVPIRGTCAYGKLNYYLGKRAADEGRLAMFPDIDFCQNPGAICSDQHPDLKWIAGLFRWITEIQEYDVDGFNYMRQLRTYVDNGLKDSNFLDSVSGIVSQGCHKPPCRAGAQFLREEKRANFAKILKILGFTLPYLN